MKAILAKLLKVQMALKPIVKDDVNPHFKNRYFDINTLLATVKPILSENGLVITQPLDGDVLRTIIYDVDSAEVIMSAITIPSVSDPQKLGSAISYLRRYSLVSILAIEGEEDDDANTASAKPSVSAPVAPQSSPAPQVALSPKNCAVCNTEFVPPASYPNSKNCSAKCGNDYKAGARYTPPELPVIQQEVLSDEIALEEIPF